MSCRIQITFTDGTRPVGYYEVVTEDLEKAQQFADRYIGFHRKKKDSKDRKDGKDRKDEIIFCDAFNKMWLRKSVKAMMEEAK